MYEHNRTELVNPLNVKLEDFLQKKLDFLQIQKFVNGFNSNLSLKIRKKNSSTYQSDHRRQIRKFQAKNPRFSANKASPLPPQHPSGSK